MDYYSSQISKLIEELSRLPGIGAKSAQRLAFHIINMPEDQVQKLSNTIVEAKKNVRYCSKCMTLTDKEVCPICSSPNRDQKVIMVVENPRDLAAYEKTQKFFKKHPLHSYFESQGGCLATAVSNADRSIAQEKGNTYSELGRFIECLENLRGNK